MNKLSLQAALTNPNVGAFLRVIRQGESGQTDDAYRMVNGGGYFQSFADHPYKGLKTTQGGRASGAYQFIPSTWASISEKLDLPDFSPASQDLAAVGLIAGRGALENILAGDLDTAIRKCRQEWTSLPGASENRRYTLADAKLVYLQYGGVLAPSDSQPIERPTGAVLQPIEIGTPVPPSPSKPMAPLLLALAPALAELIPQVAKLFSSGSEVSTRNVAAIEAVAKTVVSATNSANVQDAIEKMQSDPEVRQKAQEAVVTDSVIMGLLEIGGGIQAAREADKANDKPFYQSTAFWVFIILMPLLYIVVIAVTFNLGKDWSDEMRSVVVTAIVTGLLGSMTGFYFGSSYGSQKKTDLAGR